MNNIINPYYDEESESSESEDEEELLSSNIGVQYKIKKLQNTKLINNDKATDYEELRNKYFTPELKKVNVLIDSKNITHQAGSHNTSNYTVHFEMNGGQNNTGGFENYRNVIGFRLVKAIVPNTLNQVTENNKHIIVNYNDDDYHINLTPGSYSYEDLGNHIETSFNEQIIPAEGKSAFTDFTLFADTVIYRYKLTNENKFYFKWLSSTGYAYRLMGALNIDDTEDIRNEDGNTAHTFPHTPDHSIHFLDLVIPEIPYVACKHNMAGKHIIDRIPLDTIGGELVHYTCYDEPKYFYPMNLSKINIQLYEDSNHMLYDSQNSDNSFEFEITMLNK